MSSGTQAMLHRIDRYTSPKEGTTRPSTSRSIARGTMHPAAMNHLIAPRLEPCWGGPHHSQSSGGAGQLGSGCQPEGGRHPGDGAGQPGAGRHCHPGGPSITTPTIVGATWSTSNGGAALVAQRRRPDLALPALSLVGVHRLAPSEGERGHWPDPLDAVIFPLYP